MVRKPPETPMPPADDADPAEPPKPDRHPPGTRDAQGRLLCTSPRKAGRGPCDQPSITGMDKCKMHVGMTVEQARRTVQEAIGLLAAQALGIGWAMVLDTETPPAVRAGLVRDLLDRAGHGATRQVDVTHRDLRDPAELAAATAELEDELASFRKRKAAGDA
jgi:hypothetical protein